MTQLPDNPLIYLIGLAILLGALFSMRHLFGRLKLAQHSATLSLGLLAVLATFALWQDIRGNGPNRSAVYAQSGQIELTRARDGHYYATLLINGSPIEFVVDTGATSVVLTQSAARQAGLDPDTLAFFTEAMTANGPVPTSPVTLKTVDFEGLNDRNVRAFVNGGEMSTSLLGMSYLNRFDRIEISQGKLLLVR
ncbi:MAG: TIGR02281 family clan AA aspartic protease [Pelagimonas sp.]|jgi:aspartyl protease family protein|nr:TIGR02281 family clan AA aspartic protease [Pelagimonas sp.]